MPVLDLNDPQAVARYDAFVRQSPYGQVTQDLGWAEVKNNWEPIDVYLEDDNGDIKAAMSMLLSDTKTGKKFAYASKGPVMDVTDLDLLDQLVDEAVTALDGRAYVLRFDPEVPYSDELNEALMARGYKTRNKNVADQGMHATIQPRLNMVLDLTKFPDAQTTLDLYPSKTKSKIKRPFRDGVEVHSGNTATELDEFFKTYQTMANRHGISYRPIEYFQRMQAAFDADTMQIFVAEREGELLSTGIAIKYGPKIWYMYAGSMDGNTYYAPYAVQSEMIQWAIDSKVERYDLGGIESESTDDSLYVFKHVFVKDAPVEYIGEIDKVLDQAAYDELVQD
ncbi:lipid II:glycine glycyltransferase (peptidoglycan interpeptide bridge formation enzyme) [Weissella uvarum]|uniref:UDP-N-acetylmuramoylpentapeptide-lysine N(6)-alanyltransferase n=1 Tax=Weissella uvarum TaxID=1479233 RepID=UPI00195FE82A|nr:peptidoglycan bridge formation glycyltransferase FemA/FemB family protein [Weissella uvarum]MBM7616646.1 lipid II:glycine glycyltransferase (peptidoglycan interpeptide bridge formation enzyme) [Weissella uvarum]MCM0594896.1 peptidoglycan bridge formation glycyltransferase FemA/FemB family protein [Weissella uvarum]